MNEEDTELATITEAEANSLAERIAAGVENTFIGYRKANGLPIEEDNQFVNDLLHKPARHLSFHEFQLIAADDPQKASALWGRLRQKAEDDLASGFSAMYVLSEVLNTPYMQVRFLALRDSLAAEWKPTNGIEWSLIDEIAKARTLADYWTGRLLERQLREDDDTMQQRQKESKKRDIHWDQWVPPRVSSAEAIEQARQNAEMWQRISIRELRQLRDLRRYTPVIVQNAGQVNVGGQQVNIASETKQSRSRQKRSRLNH